MFKQNFYHGHIKKYVTLFGTLFNDIYITRFDNSNNQINTIKVPLAYSPKDKVISRVENDPSLTRQVATVTPTMGFELTTLNYDPLRKLSTVRKGYAKPQANSSDVSYAYNPVPYDLSFSLYIGVKNTEDGTRILEQILPYFTPDFTVTVNLVPELDIKLDIPTTLINVTSNDNYDVDFKERRSIIWTLDFIMRGYVFGPVKNSGKTITLSTVDFFTADVGTSNSTPEANVTVTPGLLANGSGTTNSQLTISRTLISANTDWDYIVKYE